MARKPSLGALEEILGQMVDRLADRFNARVKTGGSGAARRSARKGKKLDMTCRVEGCTNKSRGPRFGFICDDHRKKLGKKEQQAAREAWKAAHAKKAA